MSDQEKEQQEQSIKAVANYTITIHDDDTENEVSTKINLFDDDLKVVRNRMLRGTDLLLADLGVDPFGYKKQGLTGAGGAGAGSGS